MPWNERKKSYDIKTECAYCGRALIGEGAPDDAAIPWRGMQFCTDVEVACFKWDGGPLSPSKKEANAAALRAQEELDRAGQVAAGERDRRQAELERQARLAGNV